MLCLRPLLTVVALAACSWASAHAQQPDAAPVDPDATPQARALLQQIDRTSGHATLSGQHNFPDFVSRYSDRVFELTGAYPAIFGQDFGFSGGEDKDSVLGRPSMVAEVIRQYHRGAVIALTWHAVRPTEDEPVTFRDSVQGHLTDAEWKELLTPGTDLHARWERQVDVIAGYLRELQDAGVPVLFRPYHEMNGNWFWWGGRPGPQGSQELYRQIFDRYVHHHHLHNLVWVWNVNAPSGNAGPVDQYFPGPAFADIETMDIYGRFEQSDYESMITLAGRHKPVALAEVGAMPSLDTLAQQPRWAYMMMWSGMAETANTPEELQSVLHAPNIINRGDTRLLAPSPSTVIASSPVDPEATAAASELLHRLAASSETTSADTAPPSQPFVTVLVSSDQSPATLHSTLARISAAGQIALLRWIPSSPADGGQRPLDDFEWAELRKSGTPLHTAWTNQLHAFTAQLKESHGTALVLDPLPQPNSKNFWWSDRPGPEGSSALLGDLRAALASAGIHSVLLAAEPATAPPAPDLRSALLSSFFSGPLDYDVVLASPSGPGERKPQAFYGLKNLAGPKPILSYVPPS